MRGRNGFFSRLPLRQLSFKLPALASMKCKENGGPREFEPPVVYLLGALSATTYIFEMFLNSFQNLRSISQNAHWLKKQ